MGPSREPWPHAANLPQFLLVAGFRQVPVFQPPVMASGGWKTSLWQGQTFTDSNGSDMDKCVQITVLADSVFFLAFKPHQDLYHLLSSAKCAFPS
jgi:hypothetical protein